MNTFQELMLPAALQEALVRMNYSQPTEIQARAIPIALQGHDILGSAQTGTGKTAAFGIPLVQKLMEDPHACALIMTPTRELAEQVIDVLHQLLNKRRDIKTALLIGGVPIQKQFIRLKDRPRVIVGTPGRINDHLERRSLSFKDTRILVLDEADRMLDMGFGIQLEAIAKYLPAERQTFMFSATIPKRILSLADKFLNNPQRIKVGHTHAPLAKIKQDVIRTSEDKKYESLLKELDKRTGSIIIFAKTKRKVDLLASKLKEKTGAGAMHGDLRQHQRTRILKEFRDQKYRILVATDVAARGLDIPHIAHVINYDLPQAPEDYIHRIGRTARGLAEGSALCFISREDEKYWRAIERLLGGDESGPSMQRMPNARPNSGRPQSRGGEKPKWGARSSSDGKSRYSGSGESANGRSRFAGTGSSEERRSASGENANGRSRFADKSSFGERRSAPGESANGRSRFAGKSSFGEKRSAPGENTNGRSRFAGTGSSEERRSTSGENANGRSRFADKGSFGERRSAPGESANGRSRFAGKSSFGERRSASGESANGGSRFAGKSSFGERRSASGENANGGSRFANKGQFEERRSATGENANGRSRFENKGPFEERRSSTGDNANGRSRFASNDRSEDRKPSTGENGKSRFAGNARFDERDPSKKSTRDKPYSASKPASAKARPFKKSYGPQNRPARVNKDAQRSE